ncbi:MAG: polysaccharide biosynthesis/export family protein [Phycisphaerae bacterium]|nr:polysaccharide biosynthesis/export family protein [Phycisphaerae bacterium]
MKGAKRNIRHGKEIFVWAGVFLLIFAAGCGPKVSPPDVVREFAKAGPIKSEAEVAGMYGVTGLKSDVGPYRVIPGDILEFQMPAVLRVISSDLPAWLRPMYGRTDVEPYLARVSPAGTVTLPIVGEIHVAGKTLAQIEASVIDAYHPKYVVNPPMMVCEVKKYQMESQRVFAVIGLVKKSGVFPYPGDVQYTLMEALAFAGGLDMVADPRYLKIYRKDADGELVSATFSVDDRTMIETYATVIKPGDLVYVDHTLRTRANQFFSDVFHITVGGGTYQNF